MITQTPRWKRSWISMAGCALAFELGRSLFAAAPAAPPVAVQAADGSIHLGAAGCRITGPNARLQKKEEIAWWTHTDTSLAWVARVAKPGNYRVELNYCVAGSNNGSALTLSIGDQKFQAIPKAGKGLNDYQWGVVGTINLARTDDLNVVVRPSMEAREYVIFLRSIVLSPADVPSTAEDIGDHPIQNKPDGSFQLAASQARIEGTNAKLSGTGEKSIAFWKDRDTSLHWRIHAGEVGKYRVQLNYALAPHQAGGKLAILVGDQQLRARPTATRNWEDYQVGSAGEVVIAKAGDLDVILKPLSKPHDYLLNLRSVNLVPNQGAAAVPDIGDPGISQEADGSIRLTALDAEIDGVDTRLVAGEPNHLAWWSGDGIPIKWPVNIKKPGVFTVEFTYALATTVFTNTVEVGGNEQSFTATAQPTVSDSSPVTLAVADQTLDATFKSGDGLEDYKTAKCGEVTIAKAGPCEIALTSTKERGGLVMHLRAVTLTPKAQQP